MSEGTSLEDIEAGNVAHTADSDVMNEILKDMNEITPDPPAYQQVQPQPQAMALPQALPQALSQPMYELPRALPPQQPMQHYEPFMMQQQPPMPSFMAPQQQYEPVEQQQQPQQPQLLQAPLKKNTWSQIFDHLLEPLFVAFLVVILSLPAVHTWLAKYLKWAYHVGGALSWTGIVLQAAVAGLLFAGFQYVMENSS